MIDVKTCVTAVCHHKPLEFYNEDFLYYITQRYISFLTPTHAKILNTYNNMDIWGELSPKSQLKMMQVTIPKTKVNANTIFNSYVSKAPVADVSKATIDKIEWVSSVFSVSQKIAKEYLENEEFNKGVEEAMF